MIVASPITLELLFMCLTAIYSRINDVAPVLATGFQMADILYYMNTYNILMRDC